MLADRSTRRIWLLVAALAAPAALPLLWLDRVGWWLAGNSLLLVLGVIAVSVPLGTALAVALFRCDLPWRRTMSALLVLQVFVPLYVYGAAWRSALGLTGWAHHTPWGRIPWLMLNGWPGAIWAHAAAAIPWVVLIVGVALRYVEPELEEDALTSGSPAQVLRRVTLRRAGMSALIAALWVAVVAATEITATDLFQVRTFAEELYAWRAATNTTPVNETQAVIANTTLAAWLAVVLMAVIATLSTGVKEASARKPVLFSTGRQRWLLGSSVILVVGILVGIPLGTLLHNAGITFVTGSDGHPHQTWSAVDAATMIAKSPADFRDEISWSLQTAVAAATCVLIVATLACWWGRRGGWRSIPALALASFALAVPGPLLAIGIIRVFNQPASPTLNFFYDRTIVPPLVAQFAKGLPPAILILWLLLRSVPTETLEIASTEGAGRWARFSRIAAPQRLAALAAAWLVAFTLALGEVPASMLVKPPGINFVSTRIFELLHGENVYEIAGIILSMMFLFVVLAAVLALVLRKQLFRAGD